jgi:hypothetical protein
MELAYADAFGIPTFVLLHRITFDELRNAEKGVPPLLLTGQCTEARQWRTIKDDLLARCRRCAGDEQGEIKRLNP